MSSEPASASTDSDSVLFVTVLSDVVVSSFVSFLILLTLLSSNVTSPVKVYPSIEGAKLEGFVVPETSIAKLSCPFIVSSPALQVPLTDTVLSTSVNMVFPVAASSGFSTTADLSDADDSDVSAASVVDASSAASEEASVAASVEEAPSAPSSLPEVPEAAVSDSSSLLEELEAAVSDPSVVTDVSSPDAASSRLLS